MAAARSSDEQLSKETHRVAPASKAMDAVAAAPEMKRMQRLFVRACFAAVPTPLTPHFLDSRADVAEAAPLATASDAVAGVATVHEA